MSKLPDLTPEQALALRIIWNADHRASYGSVAQALEVKYWRAQQIVRSLVVWGLVRVFRSGGGPGNYRLFTYTDDGAAFLRNKGSPLIQREASE